MRTADLEDLCETFEGSFSVKLFMRNYLQNSVLERGLIIIIIISRGRTISCFGLQAVEYFIVCAAVIHMWPSFKRLLGFIEVYLAIVVPGSAIEAS